MTPFLRQPSHAYEDPLTKIWIHCAESIGFRVVRTPHAYASSDGRGAILIGTDELLDPDDCLAQMIFHELCHALVEGETGQDKEDWGLDNTSNRTRWREHACLRLQAYLAGGVGLRDFFAPTTDFRVTFWEKLPADPFESPFGRQDRECVAARIAAWRAEQAPWAPHLQKALEASAVIAAAVKMGTRDESGASGAFHSASISEHAALPSLWLSIKEKPVTHPAGHAPMAEHAAARTCGECAWSSGSGKSRRCRHAPEVRLTPETASCRRFEPADELDCQTCGACCREAYDSVEVEAGEIVVKRHPEMILARDTHLKLRRQGNRCAALLGGHEPNEAYHCRIYRSRPQTCRDFTRGSANCLDARRRVGLSL